VAGKARILDVTTNDVRGTRAAPRTSPEIVANRVGETIELLQKKGCDGVIVLETKPIRYLDVTPYNQRIHYKIMEMGGYGCLNQIREADLTSDGYHIREAYYSVVEKTYSCAVMGVPVSRAGISTPAATSI
jgi:hypothetical protein